GAPGASPFSSECPARPTRSSPAIRRTTATMGQRLMGEQPPVTKWAGRPLDTDGVGARTAPAALAVGTVIAPNGGRERPRCWAGRPVSPLLNNTQRGGRGVA